MAHSPGPKPFIILQSEAFTSTRCFLALRWAALRSLKTRQRGFMRDDGSPAMHLQVGGTGGLLEGCLGAWGLVKNGAPDSWSAAGPP